MSRVREYPSDPYFDAETPQNHYLKYLQGDILDNSVPDFVPLLPSNLLTSHDFVVWWSGRVLSVPECFRGCVGALGARVGSRDSMHTVEDTDLDHSGPIWDLMDHTAELPRHCANRL